MNNGFLYRLIRSCLLFSMAIALSSCALFTPKQDGRVLPPVLAQDEIIRPYSSIGRIQIVVEQYLMPIDDTQRWGEQVLREEAARMGADAVMLPEISSRPAPHLIVPAREYRAVGVAIRFK